MSRKRLYGSVAALVLLGSASSALAQNATSIRVGQEVEGRLTADVVHGDDGYSYQDYRLRLEDGQRIEANMRGEFDTYLEVFRAGETDRDSIARDDDSGGDMNARLRFTADRTGEYILRARTFSGESTSRFTLDVAERPAAAASPRPHSIRLGAEVDGELTRSSPQDDDERRYVDYQFRANAGDRFGIRLDSDDFDARVRVGTMSRRGVFTQIAENDDGGESTNSFLIFTAPSRGDFVIRATSYGPDATGHFTVGLSEGPAPLVAQPIGIGDTVDGELTEDTSTNDEGARADAYRFSVQPGQRVAILLKSDDFDSYLELFRETSEGLESIATDDDGANDGLNARIVRQLSEGGNYVIQARALGSSGVGEYTLNIKEVAPPAPPAPIEFGQTLQGEMPTEPSEDDYGRPYVRYVFSGREGQRVQVKMRSADFDSYLIIGQGGDDFEELGSDDDGLGEGLDARLNYTLPADGEYEIRAAAFSSSSEGAFSVELSDRGPEPLPGSILIGSVARGTLGENDETDDSGAYYDSYSFQAKEGDNLVITMVSNDFDAYLQVGRLKRSGSFEELVHDDDGLSDTHARLEWTVPSDGAFVIRARSFGRNETGAYALTLDRKP